LSALRIRNGKPALAHWNGDVKALVGFTKSARSTVFGVISKAIVERGQISGHQKPLRVAAGRYVQFCANYMRTRS